MGCGSLRLCCKQPKPNYETHMKTEKVLKAALLIQRWYRRVHARLEAREQYTWNIFQSLEYAGEQDQMKLYNFFTDMLNNVDIYGTKDRFGVYTSTLPKHVLLDTEELFRDTDPSDIVIEASYRGPHLTFPLTNTQIEALIQAFKHKQTLHIKYTLQLLQDFNRLLMRMPNINRVSTAISKCMTVCGDLHGKLADMFIIFYKNGLPTPENPYLFNGDFVDRGPQSLEIVILLFSMVLHNQNAVYLNRGNHEDHIMNLRYGFVREISLKYKKHSTKVISMMDSIFSWLPLATIIDNKVLVTHGGISSRTDLAFIENIERHKYVSLLRPPTIEDGPNVGKVDCMEWRQLLDLLWSDPRPTPGCHPNTFRGGGSYFGPDVTAKFLRKNKLHYLIRSHECKPEGYEYEHNNMVLTVFSASNYYELGSNKGAYIRMESDLKPRIIQYIDTRVNMQKQLSIKQRVGMIEDSAIAGLKQKIYACKSNLLANFEELDPDQTGFITVRQWSTVMHCILGMELPWRRLMPQLVEQHDDMVEYETTFHECRVSSSMVSDSQTGPVIMETLYRNRENLETLFRAMDKDNSGFISMSEFSEACSLLSKHLESSLTSTQVSELAETMDVNKDGQIDFNEFLEAFRIVDQKGQQVDSLRRSAHEMDDDYVAAVPSASYSNSSTASTVPRWKLWKHLKKMPMPKDDDIYMRVDRTPSLIPIASGSSSSVLNAKTKSEVEVSDKRKSVKKTAAAPTAGARKKSVATAKKQPPKRKSVVAK